MDDEEEQMINLRRQAFDIAALQALEMDLQNVTSHQLSSNHSNENAFSNRTTSETEPFNVRGTIDLDCYKAQS